MTTRREYIFTPIQEVMPPDLDELVCTEVQRVDLRELPEDSLVAFSGVHVASNYIVKVLDSPDLRGMRRVYLWYIGTSGFTALGTPACFIGAGQGCLQTEARNLHAADFRRNTGEEAVLEVKKGYCLPTFEWDRDGRLYVANNPDNIRIETYTRIALYNQ